MFRKTLPLARFAVVALASLALGGFAPAAAHAQNPAPIVHSDYLRLGPYNLRVSFSDWPLYAGKSLDFTFATDGGIAGRTAKLVMTNPAGEEYLPGPRPPSRLLGRYTKDDTVWGLDTFELPSQGDWHFTVTLTGAQGAASGVLTVPVGPRPGPPIGLSWVIAVLPLIAVPPLCLVFWWRGRNRPREAWSWD